MADLLVSDVALASGGAPINETIASGSMVGLAGLDGHGQEAFLELLAGRRRALTGRIYYGGRAIDGLRAATAAGLVYLPKDRRRTGIFPNLSVLDNFSIASLGADRRGPWLDLRRRRARYEVFRERLSIVAHEPDRSITRLSGGNQQKVLLARLLARAPEVLLLNDPTRGVDIATRHVLYGVFRELAAEGMTIVLLSSEIEEAVELCDPILVFHDGQVSARLSKDDRTTEKVIAGMFGDGS